MADSLYKRLTIFLLRIIPSLLTFVTGVGSLFVADALIGRYGSTDEIAAWATLRSFMMVGGVCAMFGMGQILVREPMATKLIAKLFLINASVIALIGGLIGVHYGFVDQFWIAVIVILGVAVSNMAFQWLRSNLALTKSYIANGSWRIIFMLAIIVFFVRSHIDVSLLLALAFIISAAVVGYLVMTTRPLANLKALHSDIQRPRDVYIIGATYFMSGLSLAIASYGENLVVHQIGSSQDVATYFRAAVVFLFPGVVLNQYLAAIAGPMVRQDESRVIGTLRKYSVMLGGGLLILWAFLIAIGLGLEFLIYKENATPLILAAVLTLTSCIRISYVVPSAFVGVIADKKELQITTALYLISALLFPVFAVVFSSYGMGVMIAVAVANLINWIMRCCVGMNLVIRRFRYHGKGTSL